MKIVIIEDEIAALQQLKNILYEMQLPELDIAYTFDSIEDSIAFFNSDLSTSIDLVFMDIHLSDGSSFTIFKHAEIAAPVIFTTAYDAYALKSFEVNCLDYILKPISKKDIARVFEKIQVIAQSSKAILPSPKYPETLLVIDVWKTVVLPITQVAYFYKEQNKVRVYDLTGKNYLVNKTLEKLEQELNPDDFIRANRQFIIARAAIQALESFEGNRVILRLCINTPESVIISRTKVTALKQWITLT